ncbi:hypothetical protein [Mesorhizobium sp. 1M-11]|uniref:hypothetical protein n=1 Tax=Mesorhizobium sp. 1M-11 TaxID=1529006 RepID=UPI000AEB50AB|nr:hypothetical protein [Mesorhizobium sp. 1M-11]
MSAETKAAAQVIGNSIHSRTEEEYRHHVARSIELLCRAIEHLENKISTLEKKS